MINIREIIRRFLKYLILVLIMAFSVQNIPSQKPKFARNIIYCCNCGYDILHS